MGIKMRRAGIFALIIVALMAGGWAIANHQRSRQKVTVTTARVERGTVTSSVSGTGTLEPLTTVEVKSNVGGDLVYLGVDVGDTVTAGQLLARIDPSDVQNTLEQSLADYESAQSRVVQAQETLAMQKIQYPEQLRQAEQAVEAARLKLAQAEKQAKVQPRLTDMTIAQARSALASAEASYAQTKSALIPQKVDAAQTALHQARANLDYAEKNVQRQRQLLSKGYVAQNTVDAAEQQYAVAHSQWESASAKLVTVKDETREDQAAAEARVEQARSALKSAEVNAVQNEVKNDEVAVARVTLAQAESALAGVRATRYQTSIREGDIIQAKSTVKKSASTVRNARTQVGYTTITAPRAGIVVKKNIEAGSVVAGARNALTDSGSGVTLLEIADVSRMYALVNIDETDIGKIELGQEVEVTVDAYPKELYAGRVTRIAPQTVTTQNVTTIPVTIEVEAPDLRLKPGMNATCNFIVARHRDVLVVPKAAVKRTESGAIVTVINNGNQEVRVVQVGLSDSTGTEIMQGLNEHDLVATSSGAKPGNSTGKSSKPSGGGPGGPPPMF